MFGGAALGGAGDGGGLRFGRFGRELQHVERSSRLTTRTAVLAGAATASFVFWHHGSGSPQGDPSDVSRSTAEDHGEQCSLDVAGHDVEGLNNTEVLQSARLWNRKAAANAAPWESAVRHFGNASVSSCFLMKIDKGCPQPSVFDDSVFGEYIGSLVQNTTGAWELAVRTDLTSTTNRAQNSFVDEQLARIQTNHDDSCCCFADHKTMQLRPASTYDLAREKQNLPHGSP